MRGQVAEAAAAHHAGSRARARGDLPAAAAAFRQAARRFVAAEGARSANAAHAEAEWAELAELRGDLETAATLLQAAGRRLAAQADRPTTPADIQDLYLRVRLAGASVSRTRGHHAAAERTGTAVLRWALRHPGPGRGRVAAALNGLGVLRKAQGRYAAALVFYRRALLIVQRQPTSANRTVELAGLYHNLAGSEHARGRLAEAEAHARRGLQLRRRVAGAQDPALVADEAALAPILDGLGKRAEAERLYRRALRYHLRRYGPRSYEVSVTLANLGALHRNRGDLLEAEQHMRRALAIDEVLLGPRHPELALSLNNLAVVLAARGQVRAAVATQTRALRIFTATVGARHPHAMACRRNLDRLRRELVSR